MTTPRHILGLLGAAGLLAACSSGGAGPAAPRTAHPSTSPGCAAATGALHWPTGVPAAMPQPPGGHVRKVRSLPHGVVVEVAVPSSLRRQVAFARRTLPRAGFVLGRGDAEADEADIPFRRGAVSGQLKIRDGGACASSWILTVLHG